MDRLSSVIRASLATLAVFSTSLLACGGGVDPTGSAVTDETESTDEGVSSTPICKGALPDVCGVCTDGKSECAHWVIVGGKCEIQLCSPSTTPPPAPTPSTGAHPGTTSAALDLTPIDPVCPPHEKPCLVERKNGTCHTACVGDTVLCIAPEACDPIVCDPPGPPPEKGCTWDEKACVWLCL